MKRFAAIFLCVILLFSLAACEQDEPSNANKSFQYHLAAEPETLDPQIAADESGIILIQALFEGLTRLDADGNAVPGVAESWTSNADFTQFTFQLREDAVWNDDDNTPVTADDFVYAFQRALDPATNSTTCSPMYCIQNARAVHSGELPVEQLGVSALDAHTLSVQLEYACEDFPERTASAVFMPCHKEFFLTTGGRYGLERSTLLCNGPFAIDGAYGWEHGSYINLRRSSSYSGNSKPLPSDVKFSIGNKKVDVSDPVAALTDGTVDAIAMPSDLVEEAKEAGCTVTGFEDTTWGLCFNRKAFTQAFSREKVLAHLPEGATAAENIIPPDTKLFGHDYRELAGGGAFYPLQDTAAAQYLAAGIQELGLEALPKVTILCPDDPDVKLMVNEMLTEWNTQFDDYFNMEPLSDNELASRVSSGNYQIAICSITPESSGPLAVLNLFRSDNPNNPAHLRSAGFDENLANAENQSGTEAAVSCAAMERYLNEQCIFYPLFYESHYFATAPGVTGIVFHPYGGGVDLSMPARIAYKALYAGQHISMIPMRHAHVLSSISFWEASR